SLRVSGSFLLSQLSTPGWQRADGKARGNRWSTSTIPHSSRSLEGCSFRFRSLGGESPVAVPEATLAECDQCRHVLRIPLDPAGPSSLQAQPQRLDRALDRPAADAASLGQAGGGNP